MSTKKKGATKKRRINSKQKGKLGELEFAHALNAIGGNARRGQQYCGGADSPDVVCKVFSMFHFEVKRVEKLQIEKAVTQAVNDAGAHFPAVAYRSNRESWKIILPLDVFQKLCILANLLEKFDDTDSDNDCCAGGSVGV